MSHREFYRRHLPHWQPSAATFFVTFRLAGSLPVAVIEAIRREKELESQKLAQRRKANEHAEQENLDAQPSFIHWDNALDKGYSGPHWLARPEIASIIVEALHHRDGREYDLLVFCIMSNHVHLVFTPLPQQEGLAAYSIDQYLPLHRILQSLKRYTARCANKVLSREGAFWQEESYDHVVRSTAELESLVYYVLNNPVKAGIVEHWEDWPWSYCKP